MQKALPTKVIGVDGVVFTKMEVFQTTTGITNEGNIYLWGHSEFKKLANDSMTSTSQVTPYLLRNPVLANKVFVQAASQTYVVFAVSTEGYLYGWGSNFYGSFGLGVMNSTIYPTPMRLASGVLGGVFVAKVDIYDTAFLILTTSGQVRIVIISNILADRMGSK